MEAEIGLKDSDYTRALEYPSMKGGVEVAFGLTSIHYPESSQHG